MAGSILLLAAVFAGAVTGERLGALGTPGRLAALGVLASPVVARLLRRLPDRSVLAALVIAAGGFLAHASMQGALGGLRRPALVSLTDGRAEVLVTGRVVEASTRRWGRAHLVLRAAMLAPLRFDRVLEPGWNGTASGDGVLRLDGARVLVEGAGSVAGRLSVLGPGEQVVLAGFLRPLRGVERRLRWRHVGVGLAAQDVISVGPATAPLDLVANKLRAIVEAALSRLDTPERGVMAGLLIGDRQELGALEADFRDSGLAHLLSVSGANVALVLGLAGPLLRQLGILGRLVGGLLLLLVFGAVTGFEPSVLRASAMAALALVAAFLGRPAAGIRLLGLGVSAMLLLDPFLIHSIGFLESAGASAGILLFSSPIARRLRGPGFLRETIAVTAAAQIGVAPVVLPVFGVLPLVALPANLLVAPLIPPAVSFGLVAALGAGIVGDAAPMVADMALAFPALAARYLALVAGLAARSPWEISGRGALELLGLGCLAGALAVRRRADETSTRRS
ncbi:MAG: ComEC/Rec2 family competence protein [Acidimicrobiia bacterium]